MDTTHSHHPDGAPSSSEMLDDGDEAPWEHVHERPITPDQWERYQSWMAEIFSAFGMHLQTPGTLRTPERFLQALFDATVGYEGDPKLLKVTTPADLALVESWL